MGFQPIRRRGDHAVKHVGRQSPDRGNRAGAARPWIVICLICVAAGWAGLQISGPSQLGSSTPAVRSPDSSAEDASEPTSVSLPAANALPDFPNEVKRSWREIDNPADDGWSTEVASDRAMAILKRLGNLLADGKLLSVDQVQDLVDKGFSGGPLVPVKLQTVFEDSTVLVERGSLASADASQTEAKDEGASRFAAILNSFSRAFLESTDVRFKFKLFFIRQTTKGFETRQYFSFSGVAPSGRFEVNSTWHIDWTSPAAGEDSTSAHSTPRIKSVRVEDFEQAQLKHSRAAWFSDCTASVLRGNPSYRNQFLYGLNHWLNRIQETRYFSLLGTPGLAVGDVNGDGLDDLYVCQEAQLPNRLYLQRRDGTAVDASQDWGVDWLEDSRGVLLVDLDNDGDQDLVVAILGGLVIAANVDNERFEIETVLPTNDDTMSISAVDYDNDSDLDLYVCVDYANDFFAKDRSLSVVGGTSNRVYHDSNNAGSNILFRNDVQSSKQWRFTDVTAAVGLDKNNRRFSLAAAWDDYDNDRDQDLYVANDFGRNNLYRNEISNSGAATFVDVADKGNVEDSASGMSAAWGDYDRDGNVDMYVGNMFSAAGGRITNQAQFKRDAADVVRTRLRRFARGNTLFRNLGNGSFNDLSEEARVTVGRWAWGSVFVDVNNDGWQDIAVANGYITADDTGDL